MKPYIYTYVETETSVTPQWEGSTGSVEDEKIIAEIKELTAWIVSIDREGLVLIQFSE